MAMAVVFLMCPVRGNAAGVTIITHGLNGNVDGWITGMATNIPNYRRFPGTNFTCYQMSFSNFTNVTVVRVAGNAPTNSDTGEIVVKLDWRQLAGGSSSNTYYIARIVTPALLSTNFIPELGHALAEFPLHLVGHSRGGSLVCELSRQLGTNGVWVDHLTTLDPHPLNDPAFPLDGVVGNAKDAPARTYENVLFHDNYWQDSGTFGVSGLAVAGAYVREFASFSGGYGGLAGDHSDVHLWYHGTLDWRVPTSDTEVNLTSAERTNWWFAYEQAGTNAGFNYGLIGGADRTSFDMPLGLGTSAIRDGFNQNWDLGAGTSSNRTALTNNNGGWPNLIRFNRTMTNSVELGQRTPLRFYYQWARPNTNIATVGIYLDADLNPLNTNQTLLCEIPVPGNGASSVSFSTTNILLAASNAAPGSYHFFARIAGAGRSRYLYAPETIQLIAPQAPPTLAITPLGASQFRIVVNGSAGQTMVLEHSAALGNWQPLATNVLTGSQWFYTNNAAPSDSDYFRALRR